jgi:hypothetical protein
MRRKKYALYVGLVLATLQLKLVNGVACKLDIS